MVLGPPLPATMFTEPCGAVDPQPVMPNCEQFSFQGISGIYDFADSCVTGSLVVFQNCDHWLIWSKSVPPTETLYGVEANPPLDDDADGDESDDAARGDLDFANDPETRRD